MGWLRDRRVLVAVALAYVVALATLVVAPWGWALNRLTVALYVQLRYDWPIAPGASPEDYGVLLNVLLFVPFGMLGVLVTGRAWWWVTLGAVVGSAAIELAQWQWLDRDGSGADVVANTLGALMGAMLGAVGVTLLARRGSRPAGRPGSPRRH